MKRLTCATMANRMNLTPTALVALLALFVSSIHAQRPSLDLFQGGGDEASFLVPVGSSEIFPLSLATNTERPLITDPDGVLNGIGVILNGANEDTNVERIEVDESVIPGVSVTVIGQEYQFRVGGGQASVANYSALLSTLVYVSNLTADALAEPPRNISVLATDDEGPGDPAVANILLLLANLQDPVISSDRFEVQLDETTPNGGLVTIIDASDPDGLMVRVTLAEPSTIFSIEPLTRRVTVLDTTALDFEDVDNRVFELSLVATDSHPVATRSSTSTLVVSLTNANDNAPVFTNPTFTFSVVEEATNALVGTLTATDADGDALFFDFADAATGSTFLLNRETGVITVRTVLDYEAQTDYQFGVLVTDGQSSGTGSVTVNVINIADNRPVISPTEKSIIINLDIGENEISLNSGTGGDLVVTDDSTTLVGGSASIFVSRSGIVSLCVILLQYCSKLQLLTSVTLLV